MTDQIIKRICILNLLLGFAQLVSLQVSAAGRARSPSSIAAPSLNSYPRQALCFNSRSMRRFSTHLNADEIAALRQYTKDGYLGVNSALRTDLEEEVKETVELIDSALSKLPHYTGTSLYRGEFYNCHNEKKYTKGAEFYEKAYMSTSRDLTFPGEYRLEFIRHFSGRAIDQYSITPEENEVLFPRGTTFRVLDVVIQENGIRYVYLEEI